MDNRNYRGLFIATLFLLVILIVLLLFFLIVKPQFQGFVIDKQIEAKDLTLIAIANQIQQQGYAQISFGNQTLILVPYNPNQQPNNLQPNSTG
ncbi:MAG: hypothetical protein AABY22_34655 [Nanoarchaeota archaeon]